MPISDCKRPRLNSGTHPRIHLDSPTTHTLSAVPPVIVGPMNPSAATLELSMIVRNAEATLPRCLASVRNVVDRILIGDTGSSDRTIAIARSFGAEVIPLPWQNDFSIARNSLLERAQCDWILVLDADEMLDQEGIHRLPSLIQRPRFAAYDVWRWNYIPQTSGRSGEHAALKNPRILSESTPFPAYVRSLNTRLFRRDPQVFFERPVHETVIDRLRTLALPTAIAPFVIHHFGLAEDSPSSRDRKNELYQQLGRQYLEDHPNNARTCFELGLGELDHFKNPLAALALFTRALEIDPHDANALIFAGASLVRLQRYSEALDHLARARMIDPRSLVLHETIGDAFFQQNQFPQALAAYRTAIQGGSVSALILAKRAVCQIYTGDRENGIEALEQALQQDPAFPELVDLAALGFALAQHNSLAAATARNRLQMEGASPFHYALAATLHGLAGDSATQQQVIREGATRFPGSQNSPAEQPPETTRNSSVPAAR
jgi:tetratricopeptide (TPR) repeat protein